MPRQRNPARDKAKQMYLSTKGDIKLKDIALELGVLDTQIRKWKSLDKWDEELKGTFPKKEKRSVPKQKRPKSKELSTEVLNEKQKLFCTYFVKYRNKTKAYMMAYGCSYANANAHSYELWSNVVIKALIDQELKEFRANVGLEAQDIVQKYIDIAFADITDFMEFGIKEFESPDEKTGGVKKEIFNYVDFKNSCDIDGTLISEVKQTKDGGVSLKLNDKMKALEWLGNHVDILDTATKQKLELEKQKINSNGGNDEDGKGNLSVLFDALRKSGDKK
ncbi:terminase small subunit [Clostridium estertheticum]|uniref:terminase small subunit n=1 Tax=Clostridium estertheticum TaxID=238834 RepID=UPI001C7D0BB3|nr:terminase small subunit [Clostridium estertheticum]MBX4266556.1 terminase small subunit [Clostridium estertheticum]WLC88104.1 terminase small subunit [Clostridium estertheticum]